MHEGFRDVSTGVVSLNAFLVEPQIEVKSAPGELRITVPKTERVKRYYKSVVAMRAAAMIVFICAFAAIALTHVRDIGWDIMWGIFVFAFSVALFYFLAYPDRVSLFTASEVLLHLDDSALSVTKLDEGSTCRYARGQICRIRAHRCDFSRCAMIVLSVKRNGRRLKSIIAVYPELQPLTEVADVLRRGMCLDGHQPQ